MKSTRDKTTLKPLLKPLFIVFTGTVLIGILIVTAFYSLNVPKLEIDDWSNLTTRGDETYIVYYDTMSQPASTINTQVNNYLKSDAEKLFLYTIDADRVSGTPHPDIDSAITPQMFIVIEGEVEHIIASKGTMSKILLESTKDLLAEFLKITLNRWDQILTREDSLYLVFLYSEDELSEAILPQLEVYRLYQDEKLPLYTLDTTLVRGDAIARVDTERTPQLLIIHEGEIEHFIWEANPIIETLSASIEDQLESFRLSHLTNYNQILTRSHERYMVYFYNDDAYSKQIKVYGEDYNNLEETTLPLYFAFKPSLLGSSTGTVDDAIAPQLMIVTDGVIEAAIKGPNAIVKIMEKAADSELPIYNDEHLHHWDDRIFIEDEIYFIYLFKDNANHATLDPIVSAFNANNPLDIYVYYANVARIFGTNPPIPMMDLFSTSLFGTPRLLIFENGLFIRQVTGVSNIEAILQSVYDETFSID